MQSEWGENRRLRIVVATIANGAAAIRNVTPD
jgi:hypothetical protein